jgi:hypothetical protein
MGDWNSASLVSFFCRAYQILLAMSIPAPPPEVIMDSAIADDEIDGDEASVVSRRFSRRQTRGATSENLEPILTSSERRASRSSAVSASAAPESLLVDALRREHRQRRQGSSAQVTRPEIIELPELARVKVVDRVAANAKEEYDTGSPPVSPPAVVDTFPTGTVTAADGQV